MGWRRGHGGEAGGLVPAWYLETSQGGCRISTEKEFWLGHIGVGGLLGCVGDARLCIVKSTMPFSAGYWKWEAGTWAEGGLMLW